MLIHFHIFIYFFGVIINFYEISKFLVYLVFVKYQICPWAHLSGWPSGLGRTRATPWARSAHSSTPLSSRGNPNPSRLSGDSVSPSPSPDFPGQLRPSPAMRCGGAGPPHDGAPDPPLDLFFVSFFVRPRRVRPHDYEVAR